MPFRDFFMALLISPLVVPIVIAAAGMYFFYSSVGLAQTHLGIIIAHTALGVPFVVITMTATLSGFDRNLIRAAGSLGADPITAFFRVTLPLVAPGMISGALFAFAASFDEVVTVLFLGGPEQRTIPRQMWSGIREQISPTILAVATLLIIFSSLLLLGGRDAAPLAHAARRAGEAVVTPRSFCFASSYSRLSLATTSATGVMSWIWPTPWPAPQMSFQAFFSMLPPEPKFIFDLSASGRATGSRPAAVIDGPR